MQRHVGPENGARGPPDREEAVRTEGTDPVIPSFDQLNPFQEAVVRKSLCLAAFLVLAFSSLAFGLDLTGKWTGTSPDGYPLVLTLKGEAAEASGTLLGADGKTEYPIKDTKLDGDVLSFSVDSEYQGGPIKLLCKAKIAADQLMFHIETADGAWSADAPLKREAKQ